MGVLSTAGGRNQFTVFFDCRANATTFWAVVVQRVLNEHPAEARRRPRLSLREMLVDVFARPKRMPVAEVRVPREWSSAAGAGGPYEVLFSEARRLVRVAGRDFALPADHRTLVLLAVEPSDRSGDWAITSHMIDIAPCPCSSVDRALDKEANLRRMSDENRERDRAWQAAVATDPIIQSFVQAAEAR